MRLPMPGIIKLSILCSITLLLTASCATSREKSIALDAALQGYDPVAYFLVGKAVPGDSAFSTTWHDMTWYFQNKTHLELFKAHPAEYAPQYDGYCAWAMTEKRKAVTDPQVWKIVDGKLYLNCSPSAYLKWSKDIPGNIAKADVNWAEMNKKN